MYEQAPKTGEILQHDFLTKDVDFEPLADSFLYANTSTMLAADPGTGKSTFCVNLAASLSSGHCLFDKLTVARPLRVYYISFEMVYEEFLTQLRAMYPHLPYQPDNLCWDDGLLGLNIQRADHVDLLIKRLEPWKPIDLVVVEPIYMALSGGISTDEGGSAVARALTALKRSLKCSVLFTNQTKRPRHASASGELIQEEHPFYGSRWIEAHVHTAYAMKRISAEHEGVILTRKKDRLKACLPMLTLHYRPETMTLTLEEDQPSALESKLLTYLRAHQGQTVDAYAILKALQCSHGHLRRLAKLPTIQDLVSLHDQEGKKTLWQVKGAGKGLGVG